MFLLPKNHNLAGRGLTSSKLLFRINHKRVFSDDIV